MADSDAQPLVATTNRSTLPQSERFAEYIGSNWAPLEQAPSRVREVAGYAARRREKISALHPGKRLVIAAGDLKTRSNDTEYPYRAHSAFAHLTGWGADTVPGSVLVLEPRLQAGESSGDAAAGGHDAVLYFRESATRGTSEFYANPTIGEFWQGRRPTLHEVASELDIATRSLSELPAADARALDLDDDEFARDLSELRLTKDAYELAELRAAIASTHQGFDDVISDLPTAIAHERGERIVEGTFNRRARADGNTVGYGTIAAAGPNACILHWTRNDGAVRPGDLILIDAGVERDSYYTADITRTLPIGGRFTAVQRRVYEAVLEAADAAFAVVRPGIRFREVHAAAMEVIARKTAEWGLLPATAEESLQDGQYHRRYMVHGTSHHLGIDVHDCGQARREFYSDGIVEAGMVFTIEPGLYFQSDDLTVPEEYRGIGVRIEDDILVTASGAENLSIAIPRTADDVEAWLAGR